MASILRNPRLLIVLCIHASISSAAPTTDDEDPHGRIIRRNGIYAIPGSPVQEANLDAVTAVVYRRFAGEAASGASEVPASASPDPQPSLEGTILNRASQMHRVHPRTSEHRMKVFPPTSRRGNYRLRPINDRFVYRGSRYGIRRRIQWNTPSMDENMGKEKEFEISSPLLKHPAASDAKEDKVRRKKWIHCHHDGIGFVSQEAAPEIIGL